MTDALLYALPAVAGLLALLLAPAVDYSTLSAHGVESGWDRAYTVSARSYALTALTHTES